MLEDIQDYLQLLCVSEMSEDNVLAYVLLEFDLAHLDVGLHCGSVT
jgi:hypothetical protein